jgi:ferritin-like metal-binding protein YciE
MRILKTPVQGKTCHAILGLIKEGGEAIATKGPAPVRDANLIGAAQRVEHYEMAGYGTARAFAASLGEKKVVELLQATLDEEGGADKKLTEVSGLVNRAALSIDDGQYIVAA